jgi:hypothetical protein
VDAIKAAAAHIGEAHLEVVAPCALSITFSPTSYTNLTAPVDLQFTETITAPNLAGVYTCTVRGVADGTQRGNTEQITITVVPGDATFLTLSPKTASNPVDSQHCVTATVTDVFLNPTPGVTVRFSVTPTFGRTPSSGSATTNGAGKATFCYSSALLGPDLITAYADKNNNNVMDPGEPVDTATKLWTPPVSTAMCEVDVTYGGHITAANGDKASFGGNAKVDKDSNPQGQEEYQDHGPAQPMDVHSINVLAVICPSPTEANIHGEATIDGSGSYFYRIDVKDLNEPGKGFDKYRIRLSTGYDSGEQTLEGGNIQIHKS